MNANREEPAGKKTLADALLAIDSQMPSSSAEGREIARDVLRRDRRRVRILTWMTGMLFLLSALGICGGVFWYYMKVVPGFAKYKRDITVLQQQLDKQIPQSLQPEVLDRTARILVGASYTLFMIQFANLGAISALFAIMLAAAVCTVLLITANRRATLGQIQVSLLALSEQFDTLQKSLQSSHSIGGNQATQDENG